MATARKRTQPEPDDIDDDDVEPYEPPEAYDFDLDALEDKGPEPEPYFVKLAGKRWEFRNPRTMSWQESAALDDSTSGNEYMAILLGDQFDDFTEHTCEMWKLEAAIVGWRKHFGLTEGKAVASSGSSNGTAGRSRRTSRRRG